MSNTRFQRSLLVLLSLVALTGCSGTYQGIKVRAQAPPISDAFRKFSLAVTVDGYTIRKLDPEAFQLETEWRETKEKERSEIEKKNGGAALARIDLKIARRGSLYDVFLTPYLQSVEGRERVAEFDHPLREKWRRVIKEIVQEEFREEE